MGHCLNNLALRAVVEGDYDGASLLIWENLRIARESDYKLGIQYSSWDSGWWPPLCEETDTRGPVVGGSRSHGGSRGIPLRPASAHDYEVHLAASRSQLGEAAWEAAWAEGRAMTPEQAVEYALEPPEAPGKPRPHPPTPPASAPARSRSSPRRQRMTDSQIAKELYISPRTVNAHLGSVYHKIGSSTRAEATRFASEHDLL